MRNHFGSLLSTVLPLVLSLLLLPIVIQAQTGIDITITNTTTYNQVDMIAPQLFTWQRWANWENVGYNEAYIGMHDDLGLRTVQFRERYENMTDAGGSCLDRPDIRSCWIPYRGASITESEYQIANMTLHDTAGNKGASDNNTAWTQIIKYAYDAGLEINFKLFIPPDYMNNSNSEFLYSDEFDRQLVNVTVALFNVANSTGWQIARYFPWNEPNLGYSGGTHFKTLDSGDLGRVTEHQHDNLSAWGYDPLIFADDTYQTSSLNLTLVDGSSFIDIISTHNYDDCPTGNYTNVSTCGIPEMATKNALTSTPFYMTEFVPADVAKTQYQNGLFTAMHIHQSFVNASINGYVSWSQNPITNKTGSTIYWKPEMLAIGHYSKFMLDMTRIDLNTYNPEKNLYISAWQNASHIAVIVVNNNIGDKNVNLSISLPGANVTVLNVTETWSSDPSNTWYSTTWYDPTAVSVTNNVVNYTVKQWSMTSFLGSIETSQTAQGGDPIPFAGQSLINATPVAVLNSTGSLQNLLAGINGFFRLFIYVDVPTGSPAGTYNNSQGWEVLSVE